MELLFLRFSLADFPDAASSSAFFAASSAFLSILAFLLSKTSMFVGKEGPYGRSEPLT